MEYISTNKFGKTIKKLSQHSIISLFILLVTASISYGNYNLKAMGTNNYGQLGDGTNIGYDTPIQVLTDVLQIATKSYHSLFIRNDNTLWAVGSNSQGQLGDGTTNDQLLPIQIETNVSQVAVGLSHSLFIKNDGTLWGMGYNYDGQLGDGTSTRRLTPIQISSNVTQVTAGYYYSMFLKSDGTLWAMGNNYYGQLGDGTNTNRKTPIQVASNVSFVAAGYYHSMFIKTDCSLWAMGRNHHGQLGDGTTIDHNTPVQIANDVLQVSVGGFHSLFVKNNMTLWGIGDNNYGQLGDGTTIDHLTPSQIATNISMAACGYRHSLFIRDNHSLWGMGYNYFGQLGDGTTTNQIIPTFIASNVENATVGTDYSFFLQLPNIVGTTLNSMGENNSGQLGDGTTTFRRMPFGVTTEISNISSKRYHSIAGGSYHSLFVKEDGTLWAMGSNYHGQLGDGTNISRRLPIKIDTYVSSVAAGEIHSLFVKNDGSLWAMGDNQYGQLGDGTTTDRLTPVQIATGVSQISAGSRHSLFIKTDGTLWAMGNTWSGQLGNGDTTIDSVSTPIQIDTNVTKIAAGSDHSLYIKTDGTLWGMGWNYNGQLGDGTTVNRITPIQIATQVSDIVAGHRHSLFTDSTNILWGMGGNSYGQLGDGTTNDIHTPTYITSNVSHVSAGANHSLFIKSDGSLWGTGRNNFGQLGDGTHLDHIEPIKTNINVEQVSSGYNHSLFVQQKGDYRFIQLYLITDTTGLPHTENPGQYKTSFLPGETVRITLVGFSSSDTIAPYATLNIAKTSDHGSLLYDSHIANEDLSIDSPIEAGEADYYSFDLTIPFTAESGYYDILAAIRDSYNWNTIFDVTGNGPNSGFSGDSFWIDGFTISDAPVAVSIPSEWGTPTTVATYRIFGSDFSIISFNDVNKKLVMQELDNGEVRYVTNNAVYESIIAYHCFIQSGINLSLESSITMQNRSESWAIESENAEKAFMSIDLEELSEDIENTYKLHGTVSYIGYVGAGTLAGAAVGSVIPGIGTAAGASVGLCLGLVAGGFSLVSNIATTASNVSGDAFILDERAAYIDAVTVLRGPQIGHETKDSLVESEALHESWSNAGETFETISTSIDNVASAAGYIASFGAKEKDIGSLLWDYVRYRWDASLDFEMDRDFIKARIQLSKAEHLNILHQLSLDLSKKYDRLANNFDEYRLARTLGRSLLDISFINKLSLANSTELSYSIYMRSKKWAERAGEIGWDASFEYTGEDISTLYDQYLAKQSKYLTYCSHLSTFKTDYTEFIENINSSIVELNAEDNHYSDLVLLAELNSIDVPVGENYSAPFRVLNATSNMVTDISIIQIIGESERTGFTFSPISSETIEPKQEKSIFISVQYTGDVEQLDRSKQCRVQLSYRIEGVLYGRQTDLQLKPIIPIYIGEVINSNPYPDRGDTISFDLSIFSLFNGEVTVVPTIILNESPIQLLIGKQINISSDTKETITFDWTIPPDASSGTYAIRFDIEFNDYSYRFDSIHFLDILPSSPEELPLFNYNNAAIVTHNSDESIAKRLQGAFAIPDDRVLYLEGSTAGELLEIMQNNDLILIGGYEANILVDNLINQGKLSPDLWNDPGDSTINLIKNPFPSSPSGAMALVIAGFQLEDTYRAGLGLLKHFYRSLDTDKDGLPDSLDLDPYDADTDDDGILDGHEDTNCDGFFDVSAGESDPANADTDGDGLLDGTEKGLTIPESQDTDISAGFFIADQDSNTTSVLTDGDTDDDGILDGNEDLNSNGRLDITEGETDVNNPDTDEDRIFDGTEIGLTEPQDLLATDISQGFFIADADPNSLTDPTIADSDGDGFGDGDEDSNNNGLVEPGETDPNDDSEYPQICIYDTDADGDVDGRDLHDFINSGVNSDLFIFIREYGNIICQ